MMTSKVKLQQPKYWSTIHGYSIVGTWLEHLHLTKQASKKKGLIT